MNIPEALWGMIQSAAEGLATALVAIAKVIVSLW